MPTGPFGPKLNNRYPNVANSKPARFQFTVNHYTTRADDVTLLVIKVPESQTRASGSFFEATPAEAGKICAEDAQAALDAIAEMASEGCPNV